MKSLSSKARKLLDHANNVCEENEIIIRAIFESKAINKNPLGLKDNTKSINAFFPRQRDGIYEEGLSVIHEDGKTCKVISSVAKNINPTRQLQILAKVAVLHISHIKQEKSDNPLFNLEVIRDDEGFEGHTQIKPFPDDKDIILI